MKVQSFRELIVWQKSMDLVDEVYFIAAKLPKYEQYGLSSQMIRAAVSIPSNIAEGRSRNHKLEFIHFLSIANGSASELETQLTIAKKHYLSVDYKKAFGLLNEVQKMLFVMMKNLK
jgi:four helix bundle protein